MKFEVGKKFYKLSKRGGGGVIWTKSKEQQFFFVGPSLMNSATGNNVKEHQHIFALFSSMECKIPTSCRRHHHLEKEVDVGQVGEEREGDAGKKVFPHVLLVPKMMASRAGSN